MRSRTDCYFFEHEGQVMFHLTCTSIADRNATPFVFEGLATEQHKQNYPVQWQEFQELNKPAEEIPLEAVSTEEVSTVTIQSESSEATEPASVVEPNEAVSEA
jgi:hypothetical protein